MEFNIGLLKGDGIGPEIVDSAVKVLQKIGEKFGHQFNFSSYLIGDLNYMKIRDRCAAIGCGIDWDQTTGQVILVPKAADNTNDSGASIDDTASVEEMTPAA